MDDVAGKFSARSRDEFEAEGAQEGEAFGEALRSIGVAQNETKEVNLRVAVGPGSYGLAAFLHRNPVMKGELAHHAR